MDSTFKGLCIPSPVAILFWDITPGVASGICQICFHVLVSDSCIIQQAKRIIFFFSGETVVLPEMWKCRGNPCYADEGLKGIAHIMGWSWLTYPNPSLIFFYCCSLCPTLLLCTQWVRNLAKSSMYCLLIWSAQVMNKEVLYSVFNTIVMLKLLFIKLLSLLEVIIGNFIYCTANLQKQNHSLGQIIWPVFCLFVLPSHWGHLNISNILQNIDSIQWHLLSTKGGNKGAQSPLSLKKQTSPSIHI